MIVNERIELGQVKSSGLVGLGPNYYDSEADLFIIKMKKEGAIKSSIFSLSIVPGEKTSMITFGGYDLDRYAIWKQVVDGTSTL